MNKTLIKKKTNNSITRILVYKYYNGWVFDDPKVGLDHEAFVAGADDLCDYLSQGKDKVLITFSAINFPSHKIRVHYVSGKIESGTVYYSEDLKQELWLCPALGKYFNKSPKNIYIDFNPQ